MFTDTISFVILMACYLLLVASIFTTLFQGVAPDNYGSMALSLRTMFDTMLGNYGAIDMTGKEQLHFWLRMIHIVLSNIFLLNYLIAILSSAYEYMKDFGEFDFKANRYKYVEKYQKAFLDPHGYAELVVHPPPLNVMNMPILPFAFVPDSFPSKAEVFSKLMFWFENLFIVLLFLVYSILLVPLIFFKMLYNFFRSMKIYFFVVFAFVWIIVGLLVLPLFVLKDVFYLFKILCKYNDEDDQLKNKLSEDDKQDRIMVYNEAIDVMRAIYYISKKHLSPSSDFKNGGRRNSNLFDGQDEPEEIKYLVDKNLIIQAWKKYRPSDLEFDEKKDEVTSTSGISNKNFVTVVGKHFVDKIIENINRNNDQADVDDVEESDTTSSFRSEDEQSNEVDDIPPAEIAIVNAFLNRFLLSSESGEKQEVNLRLALRSLPKKVNMYNEHKIALIDFATIQLSLIAFQNDDKDELFVFYDKRNMKRLFKLRAKAKESMNDIYSLKTLSQRLLLKGRQLLLDDDGKPVKPMKKSLNY